MRRILRWFLGLLALSIAGAGVFVVLKDLYTLYVDPSVLVRKAMVRSLEAEQATFTLSAEIKPIRQSFPVWTLATSDGVAKRLEKPLQYNVSASMDVKKKTMLKTMGGNVQGVYKFGALGLNVDLEEPFDEPIVLPLREGWVEFSAAQDYERIFWDTYLPIPLRQRLLASSDILIQEFSRINLFTSRFQFQPGMWLDLLKRRPITVSVALSPDGVVQFIRSMYQRIQQKELTEHEIELTQAWLDSVQGWSFLVTMDEDGMITQIDTAGQTNEHLVSLTVEIAYSDPETKPVSLLSVNGALPYREVLKILSGVHVVSTVDQAPTETEVRQLLGYWSFQEDQDADGLVDAYESFFGTNPLEEDTDSDGFSDHDELIHGFSPFASKQKLYR